MGVDPGGFSGAPGAFEPQDGGEILDPGDGPGLAGDPELAFTPFFTTKAGGSGIGLTLARQIAVAHGGGLEHSARAPSGSVFSLTLP